MPLGHAVVSELVQRTDKELDRSDDLFTRWYHEYLAVHTIISTPIFMEGSIARLLIDIYDESPFLKYITDSNRSIFPSIAPLAMYHLENVFSFAKAIVPAELLSLVGNVAALPEQDIRLMSRQSLFREVMLGGLAILTTFPELHSQKGGLIREISKVFETFKGSTDRVILRGEPHEAETIEWGSANVQLVATSIQEFLKLESDRI